MLCTLSSTSGKGQLDFERHRHPEILRADAPSRWRAAGSRSPRERPPAVGDERQGQLHRDTRGTGRILTVAALTRLGSAPPLTSMQRDMAIRMPRGECAKRRASCFDSTQMRPRVGLSASICAHNENAFRNSSLSPSIPARYKATLLDWRLIRSVRRFDSSLRVCAFTFRRRTGTNGTNHRPPTTQSFDCEKSLTDFHRRNVLRFWLLLLQARSCGTCGGDRALLSVLPGVDRYKYRITSSANRAKRCVVGNFHSISATWLDRSNALLCCAIAA